MSNWTTADKYVRKEFKVHQSIEKTALLLQYFDPSDNTTPKLCAACTRHDHHTPPHS